MIGRAMYEVHENSYWSACSKRERVRGVKEFLALPRLSRTGPMSSPPAGLEALPGGYAQWGACLHAWPSASPVQTRPDTSTAPGAGWQCMNLHMANLSVQHFSLLTRTRTPLQ